MSSALSSRLHELVSLLYAILSVLLLFGARTCLRCLWGISGWWGVWAVNVDWRTSENAFLGNVNTLNLRAGHFEHWIQKQRFLKVADSAINTCRRLSYHVVHTIIALNPRAPVCLSIANFAIACKASDVNDNSTWSMPNKTRYCGTKAFFGSVNILTSISTSNEWNGTKTGNRPTNS